MSPFFIGFIGQLDQEAGFARESPRVKAQKLIEQLTKETGGRAFFVEKGSDLNKLVQSFTKALRAWIKEIYDEVRFHDATSNKRLQRTRR